MKVVPGSATEATLNAAAFRLVFDVRCRNDAPSSPSVKFNSCRMVIPDFRGSVFHSGIVAETRSSSLKSPSCTPHNAAIPQKLFVPLKIGQRVSDDAPRE